MLLIVAVTYYIVVRSTALQALINSIFTIARTTLRCNLAAMAHIAFPEHCRKLTTISSSTTYCYVHFTPSSPKPTNFFLHGFPSSSYDWRHQISHFSSHGYGVLVPDLLGYGGTDKPVSPNAYLGKKMATEVVDVLDYEGLDMVHAVGHDFGSHLLETRQLLPCQGSKLYLHRSSVLASSPEIRP